MNSFTGKQVGPVTNVCKNVHCSFLKAIECEKPNIFLLFSATFSVLGGVLQRNGLYSSFLYVSPATGSTNHLLLAADIYTFAEYH